MDGTRLGIIKAFETVPHQRLRVTSAWPWRFSKSAILHRFSTDLYPWRVKIFRMFLSVHVYIIMTPMNREKFHGNRSARFSKIRKTGTQTDAATLYMLLAAAIFLMKAIIPVIHLLQWFQRTHSKHINLGYVLASFARPLSRNFHERLATRVCLLLFVYILYLFVLWDVIFRL